MLIDKHLTNIKNNRIIIKNKVFLKEFLRKLTSKYIKYKPDNIIKVNN